MSEPNEEIIDRIDGLAAEIPIDFNVEWRIDYRSAKYLARPAEMPAQGNGRRIAAAQAEARNVRNHFRRLHDFDYRGIIGAGSYGVACRIVQREKEGRRRRTMVIKRALNAFARRELRREIEVMSELNGAAHIASVIGALDDHFPLPRSLGRFRRLLGRIVRQRSAFLIGLKGPSLVLEDLEGGHLAGFADKARRTGRNIPNRVLWSVLLCLVRACIAMDYPQKKRYDSEPSLEILPLPGTMSIPAQYCHMDMHAANVLMGTRDNFAEHNLVPPVKLIDFGLSRKSDNAGRRNRRDIAKLIIELITGSEQSYEQGWGLYRGFRTTAVMLIERRGGMPYPKLDPELRDLLVMTFALEYRRRPTIEDLYRRAEAGARKPAQAFPVPAEETDGYIRALLQDLVYNR